MLFAISLVPEDRWENLQQPAHPSQIEPQFRTLLAALDLGWRIEEPVYLRPRWSEVGPRVYHFILRRTFLAAPACSVCPKGRKLIALCATKPCGWSSVTSKGHCGGLGPFRPQHSRQSAMKIGLLYSRRATQPPYSWTRLAVRSCFPTPFAV